jgi:aspartate aminotransferase
MRLSDRARGLSDSITLALAARAKELKASGRPIVDLTLGEPDFPAPLAAREAAKRRIDSGDVRYTPAAGLPSLREALARHLTETRGVRYGPAEVCVCHSGKHALSGALGVLLEPGDEVLIPLPAWVSYVEIARVWGALPVCVEGRADGSLDLAALARAVTPRTRGILINSPCNPTGTILSDAELVGVGELARRHDLWILSDEIYRRLSYGERRPSSPVELAPDLAARTVIIDGASKTFAMTGYRIGFAAGPADLIGAIARLHSQLTGSPNAVSQAAYQAVLEKEPPEVENMVQAYRRRRDLVVRGLERLGLTAPFPYGAFYAFPDMSPLLAPGESADALCRELLERADLAMVPGSAFGAPRHLRLSYATSEAVLEEALARLERHLAARQSSR